MPPQKRMTTTRLPMRKPYSQQPGFVIGEATMSVAMNTAPSIRPPDSSMKTGPGKDPGSARLKSQVMPATVANIEIGMRQFIMLRATR